MAVSVFILELVCLQLIGSMCKKNLHLPRREQVDIPANIIPYFCNGEAGGVVRVSTFLSVLLILGSIHVPKTSI